MSFEPFMWATFCDDVRQEAGNKLSLMGIYGTNLVVQSFPTTLIKLCCVMSVRIPVDASPRSVVLKLLREDEVLFEAEIKPADVLERPATPSADTDHLAITFSTIAQLLALPVTERGVLRARAYVDGRELRGGTLELQALEHAH